WCVWTGRCRLAPGESVYVCAPGVGDVGEPAAEQAGSQCRSFEDFIWKDATPGCHPSVGGSKGRRCGVRVVMPDPVLSSLRLGCCSGCYAGQPTRRASSRTPVMF